MPWETLQLDQTTATARDVKRAYAKLLKSTRPDQDPEGFRKLHDAYQLALYYTESKGAAVPDPEIPPAPAPDAPIEEFPMVSPQSMAAALATDALLGVFQELADALRSDSDEVAAKVRKAEEALYANPGLCGIWSQNMAGLFVDFGSHKDLSLKPEAMLFELKHEQFRATYQVIERLDRLGRVAGIDGLADLLLANAPSSHAGAIVAMRLSFADAVWRQRKAEALANLAYPHLNPQERRDASQQLDQCQSLGSVLAGMPLEQKLFWRDLLTQPDPSYQWDDEAGRRALQALRSNEAARWPAYQFLLNQVPVHLRPQARALPGSTVESWDRPSASSPSGGGQRVRRTRVYGGGGGGGGRSGGWGGSAVPVTRLIWMGLVVLVMVLRACHYMTNSY